MTKLKKKNMFLISDKKFVTISRISLVLLLVEMIFAIGYKDVGMLFGLLLIFIFTVSFVFITTQVTPTLELLWNSGVIEPKNGKNDEDINLKADNEYTKFLKNLGHRMSHPMQIIIAIIIMMLVSTRIPFKRGGIENAIAYILANPFDQPFLLFIEAFVGFNFGLIGWRTFVIGNWISQLGSKFRISPILGHPDESGGLQPIGNICLKIGIACSILPTAIGIILLLNVLQSYIIGWVIILFAIVMPMPFIGFLIPLLNIHKGMKEAKMITELRINKINGYIHSNTNDMLENFELMKVSEIQERSNKVDFFKKMYLDVKKCPTWPFNLNMLLRFVTSQVIPFVALIKSISELVMR